MNKNENKYFFTAELMNQALLILLERKDIEYITVTEITEKAGVNRSTFYLHYDNIYELFEETVENINKKFINSFSGKFNTDLEKFQSKENAFLITSEYLRPYLKFVKENKQIFKLAHKKPYLFHNEKIYQKMYDKVFYPAISRFVMEENIKIYKLEFFTQGIVGIINKWLETECVTEIEELMEIIRNCIGYKY